MEKRSISCGNISWILSKRNFYILPGFEKSYYLLEYTKRIGSIMTNMKNTFLLNCIVLEEEERLRWSFVSFPEIVQFTNTIADINY